MATTVDPRQLARDGLQFLEPDGPLARWVEQAATTLKDLDWEYRGFGESADGVEEAMLDDGYHHLDCVYHLLVDLISHGGFYTDEARARARQFVEVMVR